MALKFLNKKGWHTGSLRNIENVWKAEQKHDAEQKKLEELRKQIQEERERDEFRLLQEQAGILPRQERLEFLYDSGLAVGKGSSEGVAFKALDKPNEAASSSASASATGSASATPGALFEDKSYSANDTWRKLHSDPLLLIRQREQEALTRIKNNPVQMAMIRKSAMEKNPDKDRDKKESRKKHRHRSSKHEKRSSSSEPVDSDDASHDDRKAKRQSTKQRSDRNGRHRKAQSDSEDDLHGRESWKKHRLDDSKHERSSDGSVGVKRGKDDAHNPNKKSRHENNDLQSRSNRDASRRESRSSVDASRHRGDTFQGEGRNESQYKRRNAGPKLSEEERLARLREMQMDAELHEEQRWKRLKRADADEAQESKRDAPSRGRNFLHDVQKSMYGAEKGGNLTIGESVRRRTYYSQGRSETGEGNAFRR
ncbi:hypothetical protein BT93_E2792 [Corymbia citriodora subsp. variegata]|nr:hypothetical protein BT93_E2792 [Corymbia citriodora subsp. variegata]